MFNYREEKKKFDIEWAKLEAEYTALGMPEEKINELKEYDWEWFKSRRRYENRTQKIPSEILIDESDHSTLLQKFKSLRFEFNECDFSDRYAWIETIENVELLKALKSLSIDDLELITLIAIDGYTQAEISRLRGCSENAISKKVLRIKKYF